MAKLIKFLLASLLIWVPWFALPTTRVAGTALRLTRTPMVARTLESPRSILIIGAPVGPRVPTISARTRATTCAAHPTVAAKPTAIALSLFSISRA